MASRSAILAILETRFDHYSSKVVFAEVLEFAGLESQAKYEPSEMKKFVTALVRVGHRVENVIDRINALDAPKSAKTSKSTAPAEEPVPSADPVAADKPAAGAPVKKAKKGGKKKK